MDAGVEPGRREDMVEVMPDLEVATMKSAIFAMKEHNAHANPWPTRVPNPKECSRVPNAHRHERFCYTPQRPVRSLVYTGSILPGS